MAQYLFGAGKVFATPIQDVYGQPISNATPVEVGVMQSVSVDISYDLKELYGRGQFAVDAARGKGSIKCKATFGRINGALLNSIFFGGVVAEGGQDVVTQTINGEVIPSGGSVTPTVPNSGTFKKIWASQMARQFRSSVWPAHSWQVNTASMKQQVCIRLLLQMQIRLCLSALSILQV